MPVSPTPTPFFFIGGQSMLDFVNTVPVLDSGPVEQLDTWADVVRWAAESGVIGPWGPRGVNALSAAQPGAGRWLTRALRLRESVRSLLQARLDGVRPSADAVAILNSELRGGLRRTVVQADPDGSLRGSVRGLAPSPRRLLADLAEAAAQVLTEADASRVRRCAGHGCVLWFLDTSKNGRRRWCSMEGCGNRAKVAAHYRRRIMR